MLLWDYLAKIIVFLSTIHHILSTECEKCRFVFLLVYKWFWWEKQNLKFEIMWKKILNKARQSIEVILCSILNEFSFLFSFIFTLWLQGRCEFLYLIILYCSSDYINKVKTFHIRRKNEYLYYIRPKQSYCSKKWNEILDVIFKVCAVENVSDKRHCNSDSYGCSENILSSLNGNSPFSIS